VRGAGLGAALAVIVLSLLVVAGLVKIAETYTAATTAIQKYAEAAQKPALEIAGIRITTDGITVDIVNKGPGGVYIKQVYIYKEDYNGIPVEAVPAPGFTGAYLPLGQTLRVHFPVSDIDAYIFWYKPLRILIETDKGVVDLAYKTVTSKAYINIHLPSWTQDTIKGSLNLKIEAPDILPIGLNDINLDLYYVNECGSPSEPDLDEINPPEFTYYTCKTGDTITITMTVISGVEYSIRLQGSILLPHIVQLSGVKEGATVGFTYGEATIDYSSRFYAAPGSSVTVDFKLPDVSWVDDMPPSMYSLTSYTMDFSWLFKARLKTEKFEGTALSPGYGVTVRGDDEDEMWRAVLTVAGNILASGVVSASSPAGCPLYPLPVSDGVHPEIPADSTLRSFIKKLAVSEYGGLDETDHAVHSGIPFILYGVPSECPYFDDGYTLLTVNVPVELPEGRVLVIPVFSWDDVDGSGGLPVAFIVRVLSPSGLQLAANYAYENEDYGDSVGAYMSFQGAIPLTVNSRGGTHIVQIEVKRVGPYSGPDRTVAGLVLSKVIVLRYINAPANCLYRADYPGVPWVIINLLSGEVERYAVANVLPQIISPPPSDTDPVIERAIGSSVELARGDPSYTLYVDGSPADSVAYLNLLRDSIRVETYVTAGDDTRLLEYNLSVALRSPGSDYLSAPWVNKVFDPGKTADVLMKSGYTLVAYAKYKHWMTTGDCPEGPEAHVRARIIIKLPYTGTSNYYIIVPVKFAASTSEYKSPPTVTGSGGDIGFVHLTPDGMERIVVVEAARGSTVTIDIDLGVPPCSDGFIAWPNAYVFAGIGGIAVVMDPRELVTADLWSSVGEDPSHVGLVVAGIQQPVPAYGVQPRVYFIDAYTGVYVADAELRPSPEEDDKAGNIVSIRYLDEYLGITVWSFPFHELYVVVEGLPCAQQSG